MAEENFPNFEINLVESTSEPPRKKRFAVFDENQLDDLLDGAQAASTKYKTNHSVGVYKGKFNAKNYQHCFLVSITERLTQQFIQNSNFNCIKCYTHKKSKAMSQYAEIQEPSNKKKIY